MSRRRAVIGRRGRAAVGEREAGERVSPGRMTVAVLTHTASLGGAELALLRMLDVVPDTVHVEVLVLEEGPLVDHLRAQGRSVTVVPLDTRLRAMTRAEAGRSPAAALRLLRGIPRFVWRLARLLSRVDVVHTNSLKAHLLGLAAAVVARRPVVWYVHDRISRDYLSSPWVWLIRRLARTGPAVVLVNSEATAATLPGTAARVAYPGFARSQVREGRPRAEPSPAPVVGIIGRLSETKGQLEFVRAAALVVQRHPTARFAVVGSALFGHEAYEREVEAAVHAAGLGGRVSLTGFVHDPAVLLDEMSVCVHASPLPEPFGQVVVEAMIRRVPVVATRGGGVTEIVAPSASGPALGLLVPPGDAPALARAVIEVLDRPDEARRRADAAYTSALERFDVRCTVEVVLEAWRSAASVDES